MEQLKLNAGSAIEKHLKSAWVPEFCRYLKMKYDGRFWCPREVFNFNLKFIFFLKRINQRFHFVRVSYENLIIKKICVQLLGIIMIMMMIIMMKILKLVY